MQKFPFMKLSIQFTGSPNATVLSIPDNEMRSVIRQALADPDFRKMLDEELEKEKRPHGTDLRESFAALIRSKGNGSGLDAEDLVELNWTFVGDDGDCWTLPLTELVLNNKKKDVVFVFENAVARFEENLNDMENDMLDAVVEVFDEWL